jgi:hypothetical protein
MFCFQKIEEKPHECHGKADASDRRGQVRRGLYVLGRQPVGQGRIHRKRSRLRHLPRFAGDGRCISLLKVLQSSACRYDCAYCVNRRSNDTPRATFLPRELADLTLAFYRRNYIEGLFLSSAVNGSADRTCEMMLETMRILRDEYRFGGYIHCKAIPGADPLLIERMGLYADRMSVNIELPSQESLRLLAPEKNPRENIFLPMRRIAGGIEENSRRFHSTGTLRIPARGPVHTDDRRRVAGERPDHPDAVGSAVRTVQPEAGVLLGLCAAERGPAAAAHRHAAATPPGTPAHQADWL